MTIRTIIRYLTSDGKEFDDREEAEIYEAYRNQLAQYEKSYFEKASMYKQGKLGGLLDVDWSKVK